MKKIKTISPILFLLSLATLIIILISSCTSKKIDFEVKDFQPLKNYADSLLYLDYTGAIDNGFVIPSVKQVPGGEFEIEFSIKNKKSPKKFYYKIFYQNETYKFPDDHVLSSENFYGSWEDVNKTFVETAEIANDGEFHTITDKFRILGNPLNDTLYYGAPEQSIDSVEVQKVIKNMESNSDWQTSLKTKAKNNNITLDRQMYLDAVYVVKEKNLPTRKNNRWKRNPRVGKYKFMLVVCTNEALQKIPSYIQNISLKNGKEYVNPYYYFLFGKGHYHDNMISMISPKQLKVFAKLDLQKGIYVNGDRFSGREYSTTAYNNSCNQTHEMYLNSPIEQFIHDINYDVKFNNIPIVTDVTGNDYSKKEYEANSTKSERIHEPIQVTSCPCSTVAVDSANHSIIIKNPATKAGEWRKENVGIITRHGLTYGKYRVKVKLTELLNKQNVWNGLTNAIWLYRQAGNWNMRRECYEKGYIPKEVAGGKYAQRERKNIYSEIDIEIVKAARNWPKTSYSMLQKRPENPASDSDKVMVTYTNWDLACKDASNYGVGVQSIKHNDATFEIHRWDDWYKALTGKYAANDDELFKSPYYWFEIEWKPEEIIWRMGPSKDNMKEIGYMNSSVTNIPNNQMLLTITQEWHHADWWPEAPFDQNNIPFPSKDIFGHIYEIEIE